MAPILLSSVEKGYQQLLDHLGEEPKVSRVLITFLGDPWEQDVMIWPCGLRHDMFKLAWQKRKIDLVRQLDLGLGAAYQLPVGTNALVDKFGMPAGIRVELVP